MRSGCNGDGPLQLIAPIFKDLFSVHPQFHAHHSRGRIPCCADGKRSADSGVCRRGADVGAQLCGRWRRAIGGSVYILFQFFSDSALMLTLPPATLSMRSYRLKPFFFITILFVTPSKVLSFRPNASDAEQNEREWRNPEDISSAMLIQGVSTRNSPLELRKEAFS